MKLPLDFFKLFLGLYFYIYFYIFVACSTEHEKLPWSIFNYRRISGSSSGKIQNVQLLQDNSVAYKPLLEACVISSMLLMYPNSFSWENIELPFMSPTSQEKHSTPNKRRLRGFGNYFFFIYIKSDCLRDCREPQNNFWSITYSLCCPPTARQVVRKSSLTKILNNNL